MPPKQFKKEQEKKKDGKEESDEKRFQHQGEKIPKDRIETQPIPNRIAPYKA